MGCKNHQYSKQNSVKENIMHDVVTTITTVSEVCEKKS